MSKTKCTTFIGDSIIDLENEIQAWLDINQVEVISISSHIKMLIMGVNHYAVMIYKEI